MSRFRWNKNGGAWNYIESATLPYNLSGVLATDTVVVDAIGDDVINLGAGAPDPTTYFFNYQSAQFTKWRAAKAAAKAGTGRSTAIFAGDSTTKGSGAGNTGAHDGAKANCFPSKAADRLVVQGIPTNKESQFGSNGNGISDMRNSYKPSFNPASPWALGTNTLGGNGFTITGDTTTLFTYAPEISVDKIGFWTPRAASGAGVLAYSVDGGAETQINQTNASTAWIYTELTVSLGAHIISFRAVSGTPSVLQVRGYNSAAPAIDIYNVGVGGTRADDLGGATGAPYSKVNAFITAATDASLVGIDLTINDIGANTSEATYKSNMQNIITRALTGGASVYLMTGNPTNQDSALTATYTQYVKDLAIANNLAMIDQVEFWRTNLSLAGGSTPAQIYAALVSAGYMFDNLHMNKTGYGILGQFVGDALFAA